MTLPLVLEQTSRWYYFAVPLGALIIAPVVALMVIDIVRRRARPKRFAIASGVVLLALWFIFCNVGWQFRVDREGIVLRSPANPFESAGRIAWRDLRAVRFTAQTTRDGSINLVEFDGEGAVLELGALAAVPRSFWPALVAAIQANAPNAALGGATSPEEWLKLASEESRLSWDALPVRQYVVHDGTGQELK